MSRNRPTPWQPTLRTGEARQYRLRHLPPPKLQPRPAVHERLPLTLERTKRNRIHNRSRVPTANAVSWDRRPVERVKAHRPIAIATNGPRAFIDELLAPELLELFAGKIFTSEEAVDAIGEDANKPKPGVYTYACAQLGVAPETAVAFEDSVIGARSAIAAGLPLIVINPDPPPEMRAHVYVNQASDPAIDAFLTRGRDYRGKPGAPTIAAEDEHLEALYERAFDSLVIFLDWRHKVISLTVLLVGGVLAIAGWLCAHVHAHER